MAKTNYGFGQCNLTTSDIIVSGSWLASNHLDLKGKDGIGDGHSLTFPAGDYYITTDLKMGEMRK